MVRERFGVLSALGVFVRSRGDKAWNKVELRRNIVFKGCGTALVTPFQNDFSVDEGTLRKLVRRQVESGIHFLVACGTTGESPTLTRLEQKRVVEIVLEEANGRVPVLAGAGGYDTAEIIRTVVEYNKMGVSGILSVTPYYNKPTQEGLYQHYRAIAGATPLPIVLYNVPGRTGVNIEPGTVCRLAKIDTIVGLKEASGNISQIASIAASVPENFVVLSGDDAITLPVFAIGGRGVISVASNEIPAQMAELCECCLRSDFPAARMIHERYLPLMEINFVESNPIPVKAAMYLMGLLDSIWRLPLVPPSLPAMTRIRAVLETLHLADSYAATGN
jgi:4-hydroxy-tetrahydrodipicolinate synthase